MSRFAWMARVLPGLLVAAWWARFIDTWGMLEDAIAEKYGLLQAEDDHDGDFLPPDEPANADWG